MAGSKTTFQGSSLVTQARMPRWHVGSIRERVIFTLIILLEEAHKCHITDCQAGNPCVHICDPAAMINLAMIGGMDGKDCQELWHLYGGDGGRRNETFLHLLCILDGFLDVLFKSVKLAKFLVYLVSSHGWLGSSTQLTPREVDRWEIKKVKALGANGVMSGSIVRVVWMEVGGGVMRARVVSSVVVKVVLIGWEERTRLSVFIIRIGGIRVEMIGMVQWQQCVRERKVFRFNEFRIHKSEVVEKTSKQHSIWQGTFEEVFDESDSFCQKVSEVVWPTI
ncbi:hypothetical protein Tco_1262538 [Tanacetum coccineum]